MFPHDAKLMARAVVSAIHEQLPLLEALGKSLDKKEKSKVPQKPQQEGVDLGPLIRGLHTNNEKKFARKHRNTFAHDWITYRDDGSVSIMNRRNNTTHTYSLSELVKLGIKVQNLDIRRRTERTFQATVECAECAECGTQTDASQKLPCGHGDYGDAEDGSPALIRKPSNGVLTLEVQFKDVSSEARRQSRLEL